MTILSTIEQYVQSVQAALSALLPKVSAPTAPSPASTKLLNEFFQFMTGFPFTQVAAAALAEGANIPLDVTAAAALASDIAKSFFAGQSIQTATMSVTTKVGIPAAVASQIVFAPDPVHPIEPTQFSKGH
jgi:hypothetical protein